MLKKMQNFFFKLKNVKQIKNIYYAPQQKIHLFQLLCVCVLEKKNTVEHLKKKLSFKQTLVFFVPQCNYYIKLYS